VCIHCVANELRSATIPSEGILAAEAACHIGQYMFNFITNADGLMSMRPLRGIPDPGRKHFEYKLSENTLLMTAIDCKSVFMPSGRGSEAELERPHLLKMLGIGSSNGDSIVSLGRPLNKRRRRSGTSQGLTSRPRMGLE